MIDSAEIAILPGDPKRSEPLAKMLDKNAKFLATNREYTSYLAKIADRNAIVISTGMDGPSTAICIEELAMIRIKKLIRVGKHAALFKKILILVI